MFLHMNYYMIESSVEMISRFRHFALVSPEILKIISVGALVKRSLKQ